MERGRAENELLDLIEAVPELGEEVLEARTEGEGTSPLERLHGIRREWLGWSVDRMETEANDVLDLEEPVPLEELSRDQVVQLIARWEPIHEREN